VIGELTYMPLRLAYASTVHKTQGLTLDALQVSISDPFFTAPSMLYVALSRARDIKKLRVVGQLPMLRNRCRTDPAIKEWL
jgi:ATP-dependent DNA helicase PIF1